MAENKNCIISPSILNAKAFGLKGKLKLLEKLGAKYIHFDVMDGVFVPNVSFSLKYFSKVCKMSNLIKDVHLMVKDPYDLCEEYIKAGANIVTVHYEAFNSKEEIIKCLLNIRKLGAKAGLSIKPSTSVTVLNDFLSYIDLVLIMSVEPGLGGQKYIESSSIKIARIKQMIVASKFPILIEVDGGINSENIKDVVNCGTDVVVVGSFLFKAKNLSLAMKELCSGLII